VLSAPCRVYYQLSNLRSVIASSTGDSRALALSLGTRHWNRYVREEGLRQIVQASGRRAVRWSERFGLTLRLTNAEMRIPTYVMNVAFQPRQKLKGLLRLLCGKCSTRAV
jgi:hypothetical protein